MKTRTIVSLILAAVLLLLGGILWVLGFSYLDGWEAAPIQSEKTYVVNEPFTSIQVDTTICDVTLIKTDGDFQAVCPDSEKLSYTVTVEAGTLCVRQVDLRRWYDFIGITLDSPEIKLYLPDSQYDTLRIDSTTGDVFVPEAFSFAVAEVFTSTGDVEFAAAAADRITASTTTGHLTFRGSTPAMVQVSTTTGDATLQDMACGECFVTTTTGKITLVNLTCQTLDCQSNTGDKHLQGVVAEQYIKAISSTGDMELVDCDAPMLTIETDTGDIVGVLLSHKEVFANTDTGNVLIASHGGTVTGQCYVNSNTGDITISYQP